MTRNTAYAVKQEANGVLCEFEIEDGNFFQELGMLSI
jgi:hypothetical protein